MLRILLVVFLISSSASAQTKKLHIHHLELDSLLRIYGTFGSIEGRVKASGDSLTIRSWTDSLLVTSKPPEFRNTITVVVGSDTSNPRWLSSWFLHVEFRLAYNANWNKVDTVTTVVYGGRLDVASPALESDMVYPNVFKFGESINFRKQAYGISYPNVFVDFDGIDTGFAEFDFDRSPTWTARNWGGTPVEYVGRAIGFEWYEQPPPRSVAYGHRSPALVEPVAKSKLAPHYPIAFRWKRIDTMRQYQFQLRRNGLTVVDSVIDGATVRVQLPPSSSYNWRVRLADGDTSRPWSKFSTFTTTKWDTLPPRLQEVAVPQGMRFFYASDNSEFDKGLSKYEWEADAASLSLSTDFDAADSCSGLQRYFSIIHRDSSEHAVGYLKIWDCEGNMTEKEIEFEPQASVQSLRANSTSALRYNQTDKSVSIDANAPVSLTVRVRDLLGRNVLTMFDGEVSSGWTTLGQLSNLSPGVYFLTSNLTRPVKLVLP